MAELLTARERARTLNTLTCLLKGVVGHVTTIDLRNESSIRGRVMSVDSCMNMTLKGAVFSSPSVAHGVSTTPVQDSLADGRDGHVCSDGTIKYAEFYVQGTNIRYVHIPDSLDITLTIEEQLSQLTVGRGTAGATAEKPGKTVRLTGKEVKAKRRELLERKLEEMKRNLGALTNSVE